MKFCLKNTLQAFVLAMIVAPSWASQPSELARAALFDDERAVVSGLKAGLDPNGVDEKGQPLLVVAAREGSLKVVKALLADPKTDTERANSAGETALMMAAIKGQLAAAELLLARGAQVNRPGWAPLHYAATASEPAVLRLLLARGASVEAPSPNGSTPLMMAAGYGPEESVDALLKAGADAKRRNQKDLDAADFAARASREKLATRLAALR